MKYFGFFHHRCGSRFGRLNLLNQLSKLSNKNYQEFGFNGKVYWLDDGTKLTNNKIENGCVTAFANASRKILQRIDFDTKYRGIHLFRDPRNALISSYFYHLDGHSVKTDRWEWTRLIQDRKVLSSLDKEQGILYEMDNIFADLMDNQLVPWRYYQDPNVLELKLEHFSSKDASFDIVRRVYDHFEWEISDQSIDKVADGFQWEKLKNKGARNHFRTEDPNNWKLHFTDKIKAKFKDRYNETLIRMGYERDEQW